MPEAKATEIADKADMIIWDYAFTKCEAGVRIANLQTGKATLLTADGVISESSMDEIEAALVKRYFDENRQFLYVA